ncbi:hypothetical protein WA556_000934, partial [Blastocystis sp. ATCC 50177/Nand II]
KVGLLGRDGVGKTSIVLQLVDNYFSRSFKPTSGVFRINYNITQDDTEITLSINDFPGEIDFDSPMVEMVKSLDAILIVTNNNYTDTSLREELRILLQRIQNLFAVKTPYIAIVGNHFVSDDGPSPRHSPCPSDLKEASQRSSPLPPLEVDSGDLESQSLAASM